MSDVNSFDICATFMVKAVFYHLGGASSLECIQDEACVDISTCRICEKIQNWSADESAVSWAKECLATGKQAMAITVSSQPATLEEVEEPDF